MVDTEKLDLLASVSSLASNKLVDEPAGDPQDQSSAVEPPVFKQEAPEHESLSGFKIDGKEDHATETLRRKLAMVNIKPSIQIDCNVKPVVKSPPDSQLNSPASKGYNITGFFHANIFLGRRKYFTVLVASRNGNLEAQVFSISMDKIMLSRVQEDTYSEYPLVQGESYNNPCVWFDIDSKRYCWNTEEHKVILCPMQDDCLFPTHGPSLVHLYDSLGEAQGLCEFIRRINMDVSIANAVVSNDDEIQAHVQLSGIDGSAASDKPGVEHQNHEPLRLSFTGHEQNSRLILVSPSPPNNTVPLVGVLPITSEQEHPLFFGAGAQKDVIDAWVDKKAAADRGSNPGGGMGCPEHACPHSSRRPHALKDHLYSHYCIKPFKCDFASCELASSTLANMKRHYKNGKFLIAAIHVCNGCKVVSSVEDTKRHKKTCVNLLTLKDSAKKGKKGLHS